MADPLLLHGPTHGPAITYETVGGWLMPRHFTAPEREYRALRQAAGLMDLSLFAWIEVTGADRIEWLQRLLTNDVKALAPGMGCRAALLQPNARLIAELLILADEDRTWLLCDAHRAAALLDALEQYRFGEDVRLVSHERSQGVLACRGPRALELVGGLLHQDLRDLQENRHLVSAWEDVQLRLLRCALWGADGLLLGVAAADAPALWRRLIDEGRVRGLVPVGWEAFNATRIEAGAPWWGLDADDTHLLPETGLEAVLASSAKGCYVGQEIVARMATYGSSNKKLMGLLLEGNEVPAARAPILRGLDEVGWITSACRSPALKQPIALGYLKRGAYEPGTRVEVAGAQEGLTATVVARPLAPPAALTRSSTG